MKSVVFIVCLMLPAMLFASSEVLDKGLRRDLDKMYKPGAYELITLGSSDLVPESGRYWQVKVAGVIKAYLYTGRVATVRSAGSQARSASSSSEYFDYYIVYDPQLVVQQVKILRYQASHGQMISAPSWLKQFRGYKPGQPLEVGRQVDAISGATISVNSITFDIRKNSSILKQLIRTNE